MLNAKLPKWKVCLNPLLLVLLCQLNTLLWSWFFWTIALVPSVPILVSHIATGHFEHQWWCIWYENKWYFNLFPAEKDTSSNTMDKLFKTETTNSLVKRKYHSDEEEAENLRIFWTAKKRSSLPKGNFHITLNIFYKNASKKLHTPITTSTICHTCVLAQVHHLSNGSIEFLFLSGD